MNNPSNPIQTFSEDFFDEIYEDENGEHVVTRQERLALTKEQRLSYDEDPLLF